MCSPVQDGRASSARSTSGTLTLTTISRSKSRPALYSRYSCVGRAKQYTGVRAPPVRVDGPAERQPAGARHAIQRGLGVDLVKADVERLGGVEGPRHGVGIAWQATLRGMLDGLGFPAHERMFARGA